MPTTSLRLDQPPLVRRLHVDLMRVFAAACRPTV